MDIFQTVVNVMFFITYVVPVIFMIGFLIYGLICDYNNGHKVKGADVWIYIFAVFCPILNCYGAVEMIKDSR